MTTDVLRRPSLRLSTTGIEQILVSRINRDGGTQSRIGIDGEHVQRLMDALQAGEELPPVVLFYDGESYWLADGFHRCEAASMSKGIEAVVAADVRQGNRRDAVLYSVGANRSHGLPRSRNDLRRAIETLLRDPEWNQWSDREISRQVGCDHKTVGAMRSKFGSGGEFPHLSERRGLDGKLYAVTLKDPGPDPTMPIIEDLPRNPAMILTHQGFQHWAARAKVYGMKLIHNHEGRNYLLELPDGTVLASAEHGGTDLTAHIAQAELDDPMPTPETIPQPPDPPRSSVYNPICTYCGTQGGNMIGKLCEATCYHVTRANEIGDTDTGHWHIEMARIGIAALTNERKAARLNSDLDLLEQYWSEQAPAPVEEPAPVEAGPALTEDEIRKLKYWSEQAQAQVEVPAPVEKPEMTVNQLKSRISGLFFQLMERLSDEELRLISILVTGESFFDDRDRISDDLWRFGRTEIFDMALMELLWVAGELK